MGFYESTILKDTNNRVQQIQDDLKKNDEKLDKIYEEILEKNTMERLKQTVNYLISRYKQNSIEKFEKPMEFDALIYFISRSISPKHLDNNKVLLCAINEYERYYFNKNLNLRSILELMPYVQKESEILELIYRGYIKRRVELNNLYKKYPKCFDLADNNQNNKPSIHHLLINQWKTQREDVKNAFNTHYHNNFHSIWPFIDEMDSVVRDIQAVESSENSEIKEMVSNIEKDYASCINNFNDDGDYKLCEPAYVFNGKTRKRIK